MQPNYSTAGFLITEPDEKALQLSQEAAESLSPHDRGRGLGSLILQLEVSQ